jgi:hypothetical protein
MDKFEPVRYHSESMTVHVHTHDIEVKDANGGSERSKLTTYVELDDDVIAEVIAAVQVDEWEIGHKIVQTYGAWSPAQRIWRQIGSGEWYTDSDEIQPPTRAQRRRATIKPHLKLIGDAMQTYGLERPYSGRGRKRKLDANQVAHLKEAGESDSSIAKRLGVDVTTVWKQRKRAVIHASRHEAQTSVSLEKPAEDEHFADIPTKKALSKVLENLSYPERRAIEMRYGLGGEAPWTLDKVALTFDVSRERIREIESQFAGK